MGAPERSLSCDGDWKTPELPPRQYGQLLLWSPGLKWCGQGPGCPREAVRGRGAPGRPVRAPGTENCLEGSWREPRTQPMKMGQGGRGIAALRPQGPLWVRATSSRVSSAVPREGGAGRRRKDSQRLCSADAARRLGRGGEGSPPCSPLPSPPSRGPLSSLAGPICAQPARELR